jgi:hypothetical protein
LAHEPQIVGFDSKRSIEVHPHLDNHLVLVFVYQFLEFDQGLRVGMVDIEHGCTIQHDYLLLSTRCRTFSRTSGEHHCLGKDQQHKSYQQAHTCLFT